MFPGAAPTAGSMAGGPQQEEADAFVASWNDLLAHVGVASKTEGATGCSEEWWGWPHGREHGPPPHAPGTIKATGA